MATALLEVLLNGLTIGMVYVLVAAGLSVVFGVMDVLNVSHGELLAIGAYFAVSLAVGFGAGGFWLALVLVPLVVGVLGVVLERTTLSRVYDRGHLAQILLTFGLLLIIYDSKRLVWGSSPRSVSVPELLDRPIEILGFTYSGYSYFMIVSGAALALATWALLEYTRYGLVIRAGAEDREMVRALGIDVDRYYTLVFGFGAALAAFGGVVLSGYQSVNLELGNSVIIPAFVIVVLGGLGSFRGAVVGGLFVGIVQSAVSTVAPGFQGMVIFLLMIAVLLVRPRGLFGRETDAIRSGRAEPSEFVTGIGGGLLEGRTRSRLGVALVCVLALVPVFSGVFYSRFVLSLLITVFIWALFAMSLDVILGYAGLISLGHTLFYGLGAYTIVLVLFHVSPSVLVALPAAIVVCVLVAWIVGHLAIRVSGVYFVMITLAFAEIAHEAVFALEFTGGSDGFFGTPEPLYGVGPVGVRFSEVAIGIQPLAFTGDALFYYLALGTVVAAYLLVRRVLNAPLGTVLQSIRENEPRARFVGYGVQSIKRRAFVLSGGLAGLSGALFGLHNGYAAPAVLHWINSGDVILMAILGGSGTLYGPMVGAAVFTVFETRVGSLVPWWRLLLGVAFVLVVLFLPNGLVSLPTRIATAVGGRSAADPATAEDTAGGENR